MFVFQPHTDCVNSVAYSPDGSLLASASEDGWVKVWDPARLHTAKPVWEAEADGERDIDEEFDDDEFDLFDDSGLSHAQFTADGKLLLTAGWTQDVQAWDARKGKLRWHVTKPQGYGGVGTLVQSRDGKWVAFAGGQLYVRERIFVIGMKTREVERAFRGHDDACGVLAAGPEGLASGGADKHVKFWSWENGRCYHDLALRGIVRGLVFAPDGARLAAAGGSVVMAWDMVPPARGKGRRKPGKLRQFRGHTDQIQCLDFSPDGTTIASVAHDGTVRLWDAASGGEVRAFAPKVGPLHAVAFAPDGLTLAFTSERGHLGVLDVGG
jgi:WD40 repeat protein